MDPIEGAPEVAAGLTEEAFNDSQAQKQIHQSRLRAKREERMHQRMRDEQHHRGPNHAQGNLEHATNGAKHGHGDSSLSPSSSLASSSPAMGSTSARMPVRMDPEGEFPSASPSLSVSAAGTSRTTTRSGVDDPRKRQRAEARRVLIAFDGSVWDVVRTNDMAMLRNFFLVEGAARLVEMHSKEPSEGARTLLHSAAWWGHAEIAQFLLSTGASVNAIDSTANRTTPLMEAARAGHAEICVLLLQFGADAGLHDNSGDTAFHWAARRSHGVVLLKMSMELDCMNDPQTLARVWVAKNGKGRTPVDYIRANPIIFPLLQRRLGAKFPSERHAEKRKSRFPVKAANAAVATGGSVGGVSALGSLPESRRGSVDGEHAMDFGSGGGHALAMDLQSAMFAGADVAMAMPPQLLGQDDTSHPSTRDFLATPTLSGVQALGLDVASFAYKSRDSIPSQ